MRIDSEYRGWFPHEELTGEIIGAFYYVYNQLRYGFLESVYANALARALSHRGHRVMREVKVPVRFDGETIAYQRVDMIVDDKVVVETKTGARIHSSATAQLLNYLRATRYEVGLVLHFGHKAKYRRVASRNDEILIEADPLDR
jgi:GxxExxY protein